MQIGRLARAAVELLLLSALILAARCANYAEVFVGPHIYFTDGDCYARMTRVRLCAAHPGLVLRHHEFENFPDGTTPHTTAPLDYIILGLATALQPFTARPIDLAGAIISPLLGLLTGWFLWWWLRRLRFRFRGPPLLLFAVSPILVHGAELGRPDHHALVIACVTIALCAEWARRVEPDPWWHVLAAAGWALGLWVSAYEPLVFFLLFFLFELRSRSSRSILLARSTGWMVFGAIIAIALLVERRGPTVPMFGAGAVFQDWSRTIGELSAVALFSRSWLDWSGYFLIIVAVLIGLAWRRRDTTAVAPFLMLLLLVAGLLTMGQARWAYFFVTILVLSLAGVLNLVASRLPVWTLTILAVLPLAVTWDGRIWPNETELGRRLEQRREEVELHELATTMISARTQPFLAPWWLSPAMAYWSGQPGVAGSSHESLPGIVDSARFFLAQDPAGARQILARHRVSLVVAYDADRVTANSAAILGAAAPAQTLARILDRTPAQAPSFLELTSQNGSAKLFQVTSQQ